MIVDTIAGPSDERYKKDIHPLTASLDKIMKLKGVSYQWKDAGSNRGFRQGTHIGLIAQNVENILPELVLTDENGYKAVAYDKLVPVLIEAMKEQQMGIKEKDARIEKLEKAMEKMEKLIASMQQPGQAIASK